MRQQIFSITLQILLMLSLLFAHTTQAATRFGKKLCRTNGYHCYTVKRGDSWQRLFPNAEQRDIVRRINRLNIRVHPGMILAVPDDLVNTSIYDHAPFPRYIDPTGEKTIFVSQQKLAWGAYDENGELIWWGPISSGANRCRGVSGNCHTPGGSYRVIRKQGIECVSTAFPRRADGFHGGAPMPYCMHFYRGYALHGSTTVPGYRASHGCIRMFIEDARWLNEEFIDLPYSNLKGTKVVIEPIS